MPDSDVPASQISESVARESARGPEHASHRIVIVGGGAAGLELATQLGDTLGKRGEAQITLIEKTRTHLWKPMIHAVAAGSMNPGEPTTWRRPTGTIFPAVPVIHRATEFPSSPRKMASQA